MIGAELTMFFPKKEKPDSIMMTETVNEQNGAYASVKEKGYLMSISRYLKMRNPHQRCGHNL